MIVIVKRFLWIFPNIYFARAAGGHGWCSAHQQRQIYSTRETVFFDQWASRCSSVSKLIVWLASTAATLELVSAKRNAPSWKGSFGRLNKVTAFDAAMTFLFHAGCLRAARVSFCVRNI